jgi:DNA polymerase-4
MLVVPASETLGFLHPLPVGALWGVGASTRESLLNFGLSTVGDLAETPVEVLQKRLGDAQGRALHDLALGIDPRRVTPHHVEKSVGHEITFEHDVPDGTILRRELLRLATRTGERLRRGGLVGRTVSLKLRYADFRTVTRSRTLGEPTNVGRRIYEEIASVFDAVFVDGTPIRLIGVRVEGLQVDGSGSPVLWDPDEEWRDAERAVDKITERFGTGTLRPASLVNTTPKRVGDSNTIPHWG